MHIVQQCTAAHAAVCFASFACVASPNSVARYIALLYSVVCCACAAALDKTAVCFAYYMLSFAMLGTWLCNLLQRVVPTLPPQCRARRD